MTNLFVMYPNCTLGESEELSVGELQMRSSQLLSKLNFWL
jgi:protein-arginine kinase